MATYNIFGYTFDHLATAMVLSDGAYFVMTENGYYIHKPEFQELEYKTAAVIYPSDDLSAIEIVAFEDLPEGYEIHGNDDNAEIMSEPNTDKTE